MTREQFTEWMDHGTNPPTIDEARTELIASCRAHQAVMKALDKLMDDLTADADKAIAGLAYRQECAAEYALLCSIIQRMADIALVAQEAAQK